MLSVVLPDIGGVWKRTPVTGKISNAMFLEGRARRSKQEGKKYENWEKAKFKKWGLHSEGSLAEERND